jgi:hypothetical protein
MRINKRNRSLMTSRIRFTAGYDPDLAMIYFRCSSVGMSDLNNIYPLPQRYPR